jgi:hypothetical protein
MANNTLDVERAHEWLRKNHPKKCSRDLAELLHDYSLTTLDSRLWGNPTSEECNELARNHGLDIGAIYSVLWYFVRGRNKSLRPKSADPRREKIVKALVHEEDPRRIGLFTSDAEYYADKILATLSK